MLKRVLFPLLVVLIISGNVYTQTLENFDAINSVWSKFYQAFDSLDYTLMAEIHSKDLVRISGGKRISDYQSYIERYKRTFENARASNVTSNISLRFFERINNEATGSERGIYKLVRNEGQQDEYTSYGQFHVIFRKENGLWKILMDYDSNYENSIGEEDYLESYGIEDYRPFLKE